MRNPSFGALALVFAVGSGLAAPGETEGRLEAFRKARQAWSRGLWSVAQAHYARAAALPADVPELQRRAVERINFHRMHAMLHPVMPDPRVAAAAGAHAGYLALHTQEGALSLASAHREIEGLAGFTGEGPGERLAAQGFEGGSTEVVSSALEPEEAVDHLMDSVYHRAGLLRQEARLAGFGAKTRAVIDLAWEPGSEDAMDWCVYPGPGQTGVPPRFAGGETPEPLPGVKYPVGYPLSFGASGARPKVVTVELAGPEGKVALRVLPDDRAPRPELMGDHAFAVPLAPLRANAQYQARVVLELPGRGGRKELTWAFTTGDTVPGEELWEAKIPSFQADKDNVGVGETVTFTATVTASRPKDARLAWKVDGKTVKEGGLEAVRFGWKADSPGTHRVELVVDFPARPGAFAKKGLFLPVRGAGVPAGEAVGALSLKIEPRPPWTKGARVTLSTPPMAGDEPAQYTFWVDDRVLADSARPRATWIADGSNNHTFKLKVKWPGGSATRTSKFWQD